MHVNEVTARVLEHVDVDRAVALTQEVCRIPSVLGDEQDLARFLAGVMSDSGFEHVALQPVVDARSNALGEIRLGAGPRVVFTGHMDTKPLSRGWSVAEPFSGDIVDGRVYGHGIMDMKSALVCQIVAMEAVRASGLPVAGTLAMAAVCDHMGAQRGSQVYFDEFGADLCLLGELTGSEICLGHRGRYYFDVTVLGHSAHSCYKHDAVNANVLAAHAILELDASRLEPELPADVASLFGQETFMVPGRVYGGLPPGGPSMIPDECVIRVDCRPQPDVSVETVRTEIDRCLDAARARDPRFNATVVLADVKAGYLADPDSRPVRVLVDAVRAVKGEEPRLTVQGWLGDTASFGDRIPTVIYGPGGFPVYAADENLPVAEIHEATRVYAAFAALALTAAGVDPSPSNGSGAASTR